MKKAVVVAAVAALLGVAFLLGVLLLKEPSDGAGEFVPPVHDENAVLGVPTPDPALGYTAAPPSDAFTAFLATKPRIEGESLYLYLTNPAENAVYLKVRLYCGDTLVGESGLIYPGEHLPSLPVSGLEGAATVTVRLMSYQPETWYSMGSYTLTLPLE